MFSILLVDDDRLSRHIIRSMIEINFPGYVTLVDETETPVDALKKLETKAFDLVLLDIKFPEHSGFDLLVGYDFKPKNFEVVIISGSETHAIKAYRYDVMDYIVKPPKKEDFERIFQRLLIKKNINQTQPGVGVIPDKLSVPTSGGLMPVKPGDIVFIEADNLYCNVYMRGGEKISANKTLKFVAAGLSEQMFFRIQKSYLINTALIKVISKAEGGYVQMLDYDIKIPISKNIKAEFFSRFA